MKGELKAGGLALVIASIDQEDIGKCVTLVQLVHPGEDFTAPGGVHCSWVYDWPAWCVQGDIVTSSAADYDERIFKGWAMYKPDCLLPIDGDDHQGRDQLAKDKPAELTA